MSDFDMYILPLLCNQNENYYCWSSMMMSSYFNVFAPKNYKDLCWYRPKPQFSRAFPNFWRAVYFFLYVYMQIDLAVLIVQSYMVSCICPVVWDQTSKPFLGNDPLFEILCHKSNSETPFNTVLITIASRDFCRYSNMFILSEIATLVFKWSIWMEFFTEMPTAVRLGGHSNETTVLKWLTIRSLLSGRAWKGKRRFLPFLFLPQVRSNYVFLMVVDQILFDNASKNNVKQS